ncbi:MAG: hypothetical protein AB7L92_04885 [Alphaproteobacteria bacterium]
MRNPPTAPWKKPVKNKAKKQTRLPQEFVELARQRAGEHGRRYPNLIDNMWATRQYRQMGAIEKTQKD